jgi:hypothetical protein
VPCHIDKTIPLVVVYNNIETFVDFLRRSPDTAVLRQRYFFGDRALFWLGDPKLVFVTSPVLHAEYLAQHLGYPGTHYLCPTVPSPSLSYDILGEERLVAQMVEYAGRQRTVQLVPYATTRAFLQLAQALQREHGLTVLLPESPALEHLWVRDYVDTKAGFRDLAGSCLPNAAGLLPQAFVCRDVPQATEVAHWFGRRGHACVVKADGGEGGLGHTVLAPQQAMAPGDVLPLLQANPFLRDDLIIVEELIPSPALLSPSLEFLVPAQGRPEITYLSNQLFRDFGDFRGVLLSRELEAEPWYPLLAESGLLLARHLQELGYVGHFDLDAVVDGQGRLFLLEVNSRRTGGTHVHEFARFAFGPNYLDEVVLLSHNRMSSGPLTRWEDLHQAIGDLLYPIQGRKRGVVVTVTSALVKHEFGCIIVADTTAEALAIQQELQERLAGSR